MNRPAETDTTTLYLIRHGATAANQNRPYILQGQGVNLGLNDDGRQQAASVARFLRTRTIHGVYASPLRRAVETAQAIADPHQCRVDTIGALQEVHVGRWEGLDWDSIMNRFPDPYRAFMSNPAEHPYLDGESYGDVYQRARPVIQELLDKHPGESIAVVAHNVVNRVLLAGLLGLDLAKAKGIRQGNGCINVIRHHGAETALITLNSVFHLEKMSHE